MTCGIYVILNTENNKRYIGSSKNIESRWKQHLGTLKRGTHRNVYLQRAFNEYGIDKFSFSIIEETSKESLLERENYWINFYNVLDKNKGYNLYKDATRPGYEKGNVPIEIRDRLGTDNRLVSFISPDGTIYRNIRNVTRFAQEHGLLPSKMNLLADGRQAVHRGWRSADKKHDISMSGYRKRKPGIFDVNIIDSLGNIFHITNLQKFCEERSLKYTAIHNLIKGLCKTSNGFRLLEEI